MNNQVILQYLSELSANNNREWYHEHKKENKAAVEQFEKLVQELIDGIGTFDESVLHNIPKELTFKLVRDTRFSHDKSPYNPSFRAHISSKGICFRMLRQWFVIIYRRTPTSGTIL